MIIKTILEAVDNQETNQSNRQPTKNYGSVKLTT